MNFKMKIIQVQHSNICWVDLSSYNPSNIIRTIFNEQLYTNLLPDSLPNATFTHAYFGRLSKHNQLIDKRFSFKNLNNDFVEYMFSIFRLYLFTKIQLPKRLVENLINNQIHCVWRI